MPGGELARLHRARPCRRGAAAAAGEPVGGLDPFHRFRVPDITLALVDRGGALTVLHDHTLAARHAVRLPWTKDGRIAAHGTPGQTVTAECPAAVHGGRARVDGRRVAPEGAA